MKLRHYIMGLGHCLDYVLCEGGGGGGEVKRTRLQSLNLPTSPQQLGKGSPVTKLNTVRYSRSVPEA